MPRIAKEHIPTPKVPLPSFNDDRQRVVEAFFIRGLSPRKILDLRGTEPCFHGIPLEELESRVRQVEREHQRQAKDLSPRKANHEIYRMIRQEEETLLRLQVEIDRQATAYEHWSKLPESVQKENEEPSYPLRLIEQARKSRSFLVAAWQSLKKEEYARAALNANEREEGKRTPRGLNPQKEILALPEPTTYTTNPPEGSVAARHRASLKGIMDSWQEPPDPLTPSLKADLALAVSSEFTLLTGAD